LDFHPGIPRYIQIADAIRRQLKGAGERIPSEHELCAQFGVSRPTIRQALDILVQEGTPTPGGDRKLRVIGSVSDMIALGEETWFKLVSRESVPVPANIAQSLRLPPGSTAFRIVGVRCADTGPFQHVTIYVRKDVGEALSEEDLSKTSLVGAIERLFDLTVKFLEQVVEAVLAPRQVAELLQLRPRTPVLFFERTYFAATGEPVEHAVSYQATRRYPYRMVLSRPERRS
jgi:GntR family transcriptional regulator